VRPSSGFSLWPNSLNKCVGREWHANSSKSYTRQTERQWGYATETLHPTDGPARECCRCCCRLPLSDTRPRTRPPRRRLHRGAIKKPKVRPLGIVRVCARPQLLGELTNSGSSRPNASTPSGPANDRDANPNRSLDAPALLTGRLQIGPGMPWPGQAERLGPRHW
jgi:hypothetical protein